MRKSLLVTVAIVFALSFPVDRAAGQQDQGTLDREFAEVCSKTDDAMTLSSEELVVLVGRCDAMKSEAGKMAEPGRKIFLKRLQLCHDLYSFTLDTRRGKTTDR